MRYPVLTSPDASTYLFARRSGNPVEVESLIKMRGMSGNHHTICKLNRPISRRSIFNGFISFLHLKNIPTISIGNPGFFMNHEIDRRIRGKLLHVGHDLF